MHCITKGKTKYQYHFDIKQVSLIMKLECAKNNRLYLRITNY